MLDTLKYTKNLESAGFSREQAEASVMVIRELVETNFATGQDIRDLENRLVTEMDRRFFEVDKRFVLVDARFSEVEARIRELEYRLTIKLGTIVSLAIGIAVTLTKMIA